jgi:hypothetical protein
MLLTLRIACSAGRSTTSFQQRWLALQGRAYATKFPGFAMGFDNICFTSSSICRAVSSHIPWDFCVGTIRNAE